MSIRFLNNNASNNTDVAAKMFPSSTPIISSPTPWVRDPSWPVCEAAAGDNRIRGLYAVFPSGGNFISMTVAGAYTVDFGDGTTTNYATGVQANYEYSYSAAALVGTEAPVTFTDVGDLVSRTGHGYTNGMKVRFFNITTTTGIVNAQFYFVINATADTFQVSATSGGAAINLTNNGTGQLLPYRVATVTLTPQGGSNLTSVNLSVKHNQANLVSNYSTGWLDLAFAAATITTLTIGIVTSLVKFAYVERVRLNQLGAITDFSYLLSEMRSLQKVEISSTITTVSNMSFMFNSCISLQEVPLFNTSVVTNTTSMFNGCRLLEEVPLFNTAAVINATNMFLNCSALTTVPLFNTSAVTDMTSMFGACSSLTTVPLFNTAAVTNMSSMFISCAFLKEVPLFNTVSVTDMNSMLSGCGALQQVPLFNTTAVTNMFSMFGGCTALQKVPLFNTSSVTTMTSMFTGCRLLTEVPLFNTSVVTNMASMFSNCISLKAVPLFNTPVVNNMSNMFSGCTVLETVPLFNTAAVTTMASMFTNCISLKSVPLLTTAIVSNTSLMFNACNALQAVPLFATAQVTNSSNMFSNCSTLQEVPLLNTAASTNMSAMFSGCTALQKVPQLTTTAVTTSSGFTSMFQNCSSLSRMEARNFRFTFSVTNCKLSGTSLDEIYTNLPTVAGQTITVTGNYGTATDTPSIATAKGWTVSG